MVQLVIIWAWVILSSTPVIPLKLRHMSALGGEERIRAVTHTPSAVRFGYCRHEEDDSGGWQSFGSRLLGHSFGSIYNVPYIDVQESSMKLLSMILSAFVGLAFLMTLVLGGYFAITWIAGLLSKLDVQFATVTAIISLVILLAAMIIASNIRQASKQHKVNQIHGERAATYQFFIDVWGALLQPGRLVEDGSPYPLSEERQALDRLLALYGSSAVIKAYVGLRALARESGAQNPEVRVQFAKTLLEIRKDLGAETQGLNAEALQQLLFTNADKVSVSPKPITYQAHQPRVSLAANS